MNVSKAEFVREMQGDFARTSDSFANQQKVLSENWKSLVASIRMNLAAAFYRRWRSGGGGSRT